jgi:pyruvate dehydrogenase E1 component alpha subunit
VAEGAASEEELRQWEDAIDAQITAAVEFALASARPDVTELRRDVYAEEMQG